MDFDGVSGLESEFTYNGLLLNQRAATATNFTRYKINDIGGFDDADVRDAREVNPARDGEMALPAYYGGRTITFTGKILANNMDQLRRMQQNLRSAFGSLNESTMVIRNSIPTYTDPGKFDTVATSYSPSAWWKFNESQAVGAFFDATGNVPNLSNSVANINYQTPGAISNNIASASNYAACISGTSQAQRAGSEAKLAFPCSPTSYFTVDFWFRNPRAPAAVGATTTNILTLSPNSFSFLATGALSVSFKFLTNDKIRFSRAYDSTTSSYVDASIDNSISAWHHVVGSWDGNRTSIYVDGELSGSIVDTLPAAILATNYSQLITIGGNATVASSYFCIDELMLFKQAHTADQIKARYQAATGVGTRTDEDLEISVRKSAPIQMRESQSGQYPTRDFLITLRASDPRFYGSATNSVTRTGSQLATSFSLANDGNANSDAVIKITGPLVSTAGGANPQFAIANTSLGQAIGFRFPTAGMATSTSIATIDCKTRTISGSLAYSDLLSNSVFPSIAFRLLARR